VRRWDPSQIEENKEPEKEDADIKEQTKELPKKRQKVAHDRNGKSEASSSETKKQPTKEDIQVESVWTRNSWDDVMMTSSQFKLSDVAKEEDTSFRLLPGRDEEGDEDKGKPGTLDSGHSFSFSFGEKHSDEGKTERQVTHSVPMRAVSMPSSPNNSHSSGDDGGGPNIPRERSKPWERQRPQKPTAKKSPASSFMRSANIDQVTEDWLKNRNRATMNFKQKLRFAKRGRRRSWRR